MTPTDDLQVLITRSEQLSGALSAQTTTTESLKTEVANLDQEISVLSLASAVLASLVQMVSVESLESISKVVSYGLQTVIPDQNLRFGLDVSSKRGVAWVEPYIVAGGVKAPILEAFGGGPAAVSAFLLQLLVCKRLKLAPFMLLDESFSFISIDYVDNMSRLLRELSEKLEMNIILVTHQDGFLRHAHRAYRAVETSSGTKFTPVKVE